MKSADSRKRVAWVLKRWAVLLDAGCSPAQSLVAIAGDSPNTSKWLGRAASDLVRGVPLIEALPSTVVEPFAAQWIDAVLRHNGGGVNLRRLAETLERLDERDAITRRRRRDDAMRLLHFADPLGGLLITGVPVLTSLELCKQLPSCVEAHDLLGQAHENVLSGRKLTDGIASFGLPSVAVQALVQSEVPPVSLDRTLIALSTLYWDEAHAPRTHSRRASLKKTVV